MKVYVKASSKSNPLDEYVGKDIWLKVDYKEYGSQSYSKEYVIKILDKISDTKYKCANLYRPLWDKYPEPKDRTDLYITDFRAKGITLSDPLETYTDEELFGESDYINKYFERKDPSATIEDIAQFVGKDIWIKLDIDYKWDTYYVKFKDISPKGEISFYCVPSYQVGHHYAYNPYTREKLTVEEVNDGLHKDLWHKSLSDWGIKKKELKGKQLTTDELIHAIID